jgi:DNA-binding response OmpR family regulator
VDIMVAENGVELERALLDSGPFDLVVASAWIVGPTGLQVLAKARVRHIRTPFVIVTSLSGDAVRIMVSDGGRAAVSSRVVDPESFVALALGLLRPRNVQRLGGGRRTSAPARRPNDPAPGPEIDLGVPSTYRRCHGRRSESGD